MADGDVEVESVSTYQVLPKEVTAEIGTIKLFNKWSYEDVEIRDISLTYVGGYLSLLRSQVGSNANQDLQRLHSNTPTSLHLSLRGQICRQAFPQSTMPDHRATHKFTDDERPEQRKETHGCSHCCTCL